MTGGLGECLQEFGARGDSWDLSGSVSGDHYPEYENISNPDRLDLAHSGDWRHTKYLLATTSFRLIPGNYWSELTMTDFDGGAVFFYPVHYPVRPILKPRAVSPGPEASWLDFGGDSLLTVVECDGYRYEQLRGWPGEFWPYVWGPPSPLGVGGYKVSGQDHWPDGNVQCHTMYAPLNLKCDCAESPVASLIVLGCSVLNMAMVLPGNGGYANGRPAVITSARCRFRSIDAPP